MVDLASKQEESIPLDKMSIVELLEHLENMIIKREKITAVPISKRKESNRSRIVQ